MNSSAIIGTRIKNYRERLGLSPEELAKNSGVDVALINHIESGKEYPGIGVMVKLARALGQRLGTFMDDQFEDDPLIVRSSERKEETAAYQGGAVGHYHYYSLAKNKSDRHMEPFYIVIDPNQEKKLSSHEGEEFIIVVSGEVELIYGKERQVLKAGDSVYYNSIVPHHIGTAGSEKAQIYAMVYTPI
ncbi:MAG: DNA-binding transcriptional repressor PuuR [Methanomassiliicoccales archaeon PtaU1.Bin124]|nr:MAG: DNA-binding transcriptional repressor PuuR [Methanomassiliicoccales archaeon PtaU1.Bin124]